MQNDKSHHRNIKISQQELFQTFEHSHKHTHSNNLSHPKVQHNQMHNYKAQTRVH